MTKFKSKKMAFFTDIHYGCADAKKEESIIHNTFCDNFIDFFIKEVKADPEIDSIGFLGDWNQNRTSINLETLRYAYIGFKKLNDLGLPIYVILGNHDLYKRNSREIHSLHWVEQFENVHLIENPEVLKNSYKGGQNVLFCPFLMHHEYADLVQYNSVPVWFGHFEFNGYIVTGHGTEMIGGADPDLFQQPELIVSGHFHKRQTRKNKNIVYMGNPFPTSFGDEGDVDRGYATYDFTTKELFFFNWEDGPKYIYTTISDIIDGEVEIDDRTYVKCVADIPLNYEDSADMQRHVMTTYNPRRFELRESAEVNEIITTAPLQKSTEDIDTVDNLVVDMFKKIDSEHINNDMLVSIYNDLVS